MKRIAILALVLVTSSAALADPMKLSGSLRVRAEQWSFFETSGFDDEYLFGAALLRASAAQQVNPSLDWQFELAAPMLIGLPDRAVAPAPRGQLGLGGTYYAANADTDVASVFPKQAFVRFRNGAHAIRAGRFELGEGGEVVPKNASLAAVKNARIAQRLIGAFGFSHVGRSADGAQYVFNTPALNVTAAAFRPTVGAFNTDGLGEVDDVGVVYAALTRSGANDDARLFIMGYRDNRPLLKTDNRPAAARAQDLGDIKVSTIGAHYLRAFGNANVLAWIALQGGDWGLLEHRASAIALEGGYNFAGDRKLRGGLFVSSGDDDPADDEHGTFFQVLPTPRAYARFPFYNAMNSKDAFVQYSMKPHTKVTLVSELHFLKLTEDRDLWYAGGGAFEDRSFGFAGRPANGSDDLARVLDVSVDYAMNPKTSFTAYAGFARGGDVVDAIFDDESARFVYVEVTRRF
ncbi:MAG: alginate export family protein [Thermoanaerobaculia bacterium]